jgi:hypothetical protein
MPFPIARWKTPYALALLMGLTVVGWEVLHAADDPVVIAPPKLDSPKAAHATQTAVLAGGCFWGVQGVFEHVKGVSKVLSGYAGGDKSGARYEAVSSGTTGHAESVQITFDPAEDYHQDFLIHNPRHPYIVFNDLPKVENFKRLFPNTYRGQPVMVSGTATK